MHFMNFLVSRYLNAEADSDQRATVLSFKGLSTNVSYGAISILYSVLVTGIREDAQRRHVNLPGAWKPPFLFLPSVLPAVFILGVLAALVLYR